MYELLLGILYLAQLATFALGGACLGSAYLCYIMRKANGESWVKGRSHCDSCGTTLQWHDLIPVISYLKNAGRCKYCGAEIPSICLQTEVLFGIAASLLYEGAFRAQGAKTLLCALSAATTIFAIYRIRKVLKGAC